MACLTVGNTQFRSDRDETKHDADDGRRRVQRGELYVGLAQIEQESRECECPAMRSSFGGIVVSN